jgi:alpha-mannosidase
MMTDERPPCTMDIPLTTGVAVRVLTERVVPVVHAAAIPLEVGWHDLPGEPVPPFEGLAISPQQLGAAR